MLLSLFRLSMMVLLFSAVCVEVNGEKSSFVSSEKDKAVADIPPDSNFIAKEESLHNPKEILMKKRQAKNNRHCNQHGSKRRGANTDNRITRSGGGNLAQKMAKEALKSPQMQHTMNKLTHGKSSKKNLYANIKLSAPAKGGKARDLEMINGKPVALKGRKKKKRKRHHRHYRNQHGIGSKRGSSKRPLNTRRDTSVSARKLNGKENSINKRNQATVKNKSRNKSISKPNEKVTAVKIDDSDYVDFSSPLYTETTILPRSHRSSVKLDDGESMVERLMKTTTKDPSKKPPGDRGVEYSDYYSEDDVLQDIAANKIPVEVAENPSDRFTREIVNSSGFLDNQIDRNAQTCRDHDARGTDFRYTDDSLDNFQNYPSLEHFGLNRHSRLHGADEIGFYGPSDDGNANLDSGYSANIVEDVEPSISEPIPTDFGVHDNLELSDQQIQQVDPDNINYYNRYETQQDGRSDNNDDGNGSRYFNVEENAGQENLSNFSQNENVNLAPQFYDKFDVPETQDSYNYQEGSNSQRLNQNIEEENVALKNFPEQVESNYHEDLTLPPYIVNAIDLPLGKFLETLGIHVYTETSVPNQTSNLVANLQLSTPINLIDKSGIAPDSEIQRRPVGHFLSPSYLKKNTKKDSNSQNKTINVNGNQNCREGHTTGQSIDTHTTILPLTHNDNNSVSHDNISIAMHDTKEVANQILDTIMDELKELKLDRTMNNEREGSWSTAQAGMKLDMKVVNHSIIVTLSDLTSTKFHESLLNGTWNVSGQAPFKRGSPFTLVATDNYSNSLAVFVGTCRVCQGVDTIAGVWSIARQPKDCRDFQVVTSVFNDIFHKSKLSSLKEEQHNTNATENATVKNEKKIN